jgi:hypothetical protein
MQPTAVLEAHQHAVIRIADAERLSLTVDHLDKPA